MAYFKLMTIEMIGLNEDTMRDERKREWTGEREEGWGRRRRVGKNHFRLSFQYCIIISSVLILLFACFAMPHVTSIPNDRRLIYKHQITNFDYSSVDYVDGFCLHSLQFEYHLIRPYDLTY